MKNAPVISVAVLNWNGKRYIDPFFKSLLEQTYPMDKIEILFIDNASMDDSIEYVKNTYADKISIKIIENKKNYGYAKGNNLGLKHATGRYILVVNNDIVMHKELIKELVMISIENKAAATVPKLMFLNKHGKINNAGSFLKPGSTWPVIERGYNEEDKGQYEKQDEISAFCGACVLFSRGFLSKVGLYDSRFFMYFEDSDLSWRGQSEGYKYYYAPKAIAYHVHTGSSKEGSPLFNHYVTRNRILILAKNAKIKILIKGLAETYYWNLVVRVLSLIKSFLGKGSKRCALKEFTSSQITLMSIWLNLPYAFAKRWRILKEEKL